MPRRVWIFSVSVVLTMVGVVALTSLSQPAPLDRNAVLNPFGDM